MSQSLLIFVAFIALMYFMMIRPQQKTAKKRQNMLNELKPGSEIVTIGGLHGKVDSLDTNTFTLDADGVFLTFERSAIRTVVENKDLTESVETNVAPVEVKNEKIVDNADSEKEDAISNKED
ncbi:preprotein translocase subunit YajC [Weissella coleopterorum]|uniref:Preprotein translocase subunit YajC n=1 Tax=Weissella coleopterorum TaxID=2714949 RepID=A0A6G8B064_9LACO|nr:preprotein translocase subunit YajC [Weissella coleopterorum]QIL50605.1 preprotein translocase subunit YajC [Weissella coleopterorum]